MAHIVANIIIFLFLCHLVSPDTLCFSRLFSFMKQGNICVIYMHTITSLYFFNNTYRGSGLQSVSHTLNYEAIDFTGSLNGYR